MSCVTRCCSWKQESLKCWLLLGVFCLRSVFHSHVCTVTSNINSIWHVPFVLTVVGLLVARSCQHTWPWSVEKFTVIYTQIKVVKNWCLWKARLSWVCLKLSSLQLFSFYVLHFFLSFVCSSTELHFISYINTITWLVDGCHMPYLPYGTCKVLVVPFVG